MPMMYCVCVHCKHDGGYFSVNAVGYEEEHRQQYWDDPTGKELDWKMVENARAEEIATVKQMGVWRHVPRKEFLRNTGRQPIKAGWVDINKGDDVVPLYTSRIVAKEIKTNFRPDPFAATPLVEYIKCLILTAATGQNHGLGRRLMLQDISKAYFFAHAKRLLYVELPAEDMALGMVGLLEQSLYGTRDAALSWSEAYTDVLVDMGFEKGVSSPCSFFHARWDLRVVVHGGDFLTEGPVASLKLMDTALRKKLNVKTKVLGLDAGQVPQVRGAISLMLSSIMS